MYLVQIILKIIKNCLNKSVYFIMHVYISFFTDKFIESLIFQWHWGYFFFGWRIFRDILPTKANISVRGVSVAVLCGNDIETSLHTVYFTLFGIKLENYWLPSTIDFLPCILHFYKINLGDAKGFILKTPPCLGWYLETEKLYPSWQVLCYQANYY